MLLKLKSLLFLLQALLILVSHFSVSDSNFKRWADRSALAATGVCDFGFDPISADALPVSRSERGRCRVWYDAHIRTAENPAYDFTVGGRSLRGHLDEWDITVGEESAVGEQRRGGKTTVISLRHLKSDLTAQVEATIYEPYATCEWTVRIHNAGSTPSPVIKRFYAADCTMDVGTPTLYVSRGSAPAADDFTLVQSAVSPTPMVFNANGGRSESFLPYFNLCGERFGAVLSVGWTGQWYTSLRQTLRGVHLTAKQEFFRAGLFAGESVRSPLVTLTFYEGGNALKGFETFRDWETDCVCPETIQPMKGYVIANEFSTKTCDELIDQFNAIDPAVLEATDYFWMDAGWYTYKEGWYDGVGNWIPDPVRFPQTLKPLSDAMAAKGKRFLLWYEPERVREGTALYRKGTEQSEWIMQIEDNLMWNLGNDNACSYLEDVISASLLENGVSIYRQDFNFSPLKYWQKADREWYGGRKGICENHYVTNLYRYLDTLCARVDGLMIDNCASGGKRLDIEMTRRSIPLWRSDYNCGSADGSFQPDVLEATQSMTYGLSFWLPYSGTNQHYHSLYAIRSALLTHGSCYEPDREQYRAYDAVRSYMTQRYFPLTYGGTDSKRFLAMQFGSETAGAAMVYKRADVPSKTYSLRLNGLYPDRLYTITDMDDPTYPIVVEGSELMGSGVMLPIPDAPYAKVLQYSLLASTTN